MPDDRARADIYYRSRRKREPSLMDKGMYGHAARTSAAIAEGKG